MSKKNEKRLCWNCDGDVSSNFEQCPYCGVDLSSAQNQFDPSSFGYSLYQTPESSSPFETPPDPISEEEWNQTLNEETPEPQETHPTNRSEMVALLLLLPGVVFMLFSIALFFFSDEGIFTLSWNQNFAYFYFLGAVPLIVLGWRALK